MRSLGGPMVKLVDTRDLKSLGASCTGSNPVRATKTPLFSIWKIIEKRRKSSKKSLKALDFKDSKAFLFFQPLEKQGKA